MAFRKHEKLEIAATIYEQLLQGKSDTEIMEALRCGVETYRECKAALFEEKSDEARGKSREHVYIEYCIEQRRNIKALDDLVENLDRKNQYNAVIGAIRLRSDITDKIITRGQEFGLIKKQLERRDIVAGLIITDMSSEDLKNRILEQTKLLDDCMASYGEKDFLKIPAGLLHYGEKAIDVDGEVVEGDAVESEDDEELLDTPPLVAKVKKKVVSHPKKSGRRSVV